MTNKPPESEHIGAGVSALSAADWQALEANAGPFVDWRFLAALEQQHCVGADSGWQPFPLTVHAEGQLKAAAPAYLKSHSHGEFVFDWAWAHAAQSNGIRWYPKLLLAAPFSPVPGPRLLGASSNRDAAMGLVQQAETRVARLGLSSAGVNFCRDQDADVLRAAGWLERFDWQFHWQNAGYRDFDDFLDHLRRKPRKNIRAERRRVIEDGWQFEWKDGSMLEPDELELAHRCYQSTFALYGNLPMLNASFFTRMARDFGKQFLVCLASRNRINSAAAIFWRDDHRLYGRYWGSLDETRDVHFEACYYQGIEFCIRHGLRWFEPGAQGEHKIRRGFLPHKTRSFHFIAHPGMREGIARFLEAEAVALNQYRQYLQQLDPFA